MTDSETYEVTVVGGGPAGLTTALYTTRLGHDTAMINRGGGRAAMMKDTHNVVGVTEDVSGVEWLQTGVEQIQDYGADYHRDFVESIERREDGSFLVEANDITVETEAVVLATGFSDERPDPPLPRTGAGLHYCLHCDAYMFVDEPVYVMGHGEATAHVAMIMLNFTPEVDILLRGDDPTWSEETDEQVRAHPIDIVDAEVAGIENGDDGWLEAIEFEESVGPRPTGSRTESGDGTRREYRGGFAMYGSDYNTELAKQLGCDLTDGGEIAVGDHGKTSVDGVWAVGDIVPGHNQIPVAMGQGAKAGIDVHYDHRTFPMDTEEIAARGGIDESDVPGLSPRLREIANDHHSGPPSKPDEATADD